MTKDKIFLVITFLVCVGFAVRINYLENQISKKEPVEDLFGDYIEYSKDVENKLKNGGEVGINDFEVLDLYQSIFDIQLQAAEKQNSKIFTMAQKKFAKENRNQFVK